MNFIAQIRIEVCVIIFACTACFNGTAWSQQRFVTTPVDLTSMEAFSNPPQNWIIVGSATGGYEDVSLQRSKGTGVLYNNFSEKIQFKSDANLMTKVEHGDIFLTTDFMMPKGSNAGIYFQGRYEI